MRSFVDVAGVRAVALVSLPLLVVVMVGALLGWRRRGGPTVASYGAWGLSGLMVAFSVVGALSIGVFVLPVGVLLLMACGRSVVPVLPPPKAQA
ncbi:MAG TPA: hypothetical protein VMV14_04370 [Acidimicrobiales bacterium]|nr:hypothetical protein [Acidimicrobiales bacterium]